MLGRAISEETPQSKHWTVGHTFMLIEQGLISIETELGMKGYNRTSLQRPPLPAKATGHCGEVGIVGRLK